ncbi:MAG: AI-2E family transporter, partial [Spirochaetaceae bacterium]
MYLLHRMEGHRLTNAFLFVLAVVAIATVLRVASTVFLPLAVAILLSFVFSPVVRFLQRIRIPRIIGIVIVILFLLALGFLVGLVLYSSTQSLLRRFPEYQQRFTSLVQQLIVRFDLPQDILFQLEIGTAIRSIALEVSGNLVSFLSGFTLVVIFLLFMLLEEPYLRTKLMDAVQGRATRKVTIMIAHINQQVSRYLVVKFLISGFTAGAVFLEYLIIGVDFPFIWLVLTFLFNFIPSIGSIAITIIASVFALVQFLPDWNLVILAAGAMAMTQLLIGNIMDPQLLGERLNLSPVVILLSLLLWGYIWGIMG